MALQDTCSEYFQCSFENWNVHFEDFIHESIVLKVPHDVVNYLKSDIMVLPQNSLSSQTNRINSFWSANEVELEEPNFSEFDEKIWKAIKQLGGKVFIKLNRSAPKDASWITSTRSLCCSDPADIYLLLKSSTCISDDLSLLSEELESTNPNLCCLVLKKWEEIHPGTEFRCFVLNSRLIGICQRDGTSYFKYIDESKEEIVKAITTFYHNHIKNNFILTFYTFDIVILPNKKIILMDFGVLNKKTECLMFSLEELKRKTRHDSTEDTEEPEFRFIDEHTNVTQNQCKHYGIPIDLVHFCNDKKSVVDFIEDEIIHKKS